MIKQLKNKAFFTTQEAREAGVSKRMLSYWTNKGTIERLQRGVYRFVDDTSNLDLKWADLYRATVTTQGVVCLLSALDVYGLTEAFVDEHWIAVENERGHLQQPGIRFVRVRNIDFERRNHKMDGFSLPIFSVERTIIDSFRLLDKETALKALKGYCQSIAGQPDYAKLNQCAKQLRVKIHPYLESIMA